MAFFQSLTQLFFLLFTVVTLSVLMVIVVGLLLERSRFGRAHRIFDLPLRRGQYGREVRRNLQYCVVFALASALVLKTAFFSQGATAAILTYLICFYSFEIYYYLTHRLLHTPRFFKFHKTHHDSQITSPLTGLSQGWVETLISVFGLVGLPGMISCVFPVHLGGWFAHLLFNFLFNILGHVNSEITPPIVGKMPVSFIFHPITYHALHHARYTKHFCFVLTFLDSLGKTQWEDWEGVHQRVLAQRPLKKLSETVAEV